MSFFLSLYYYNFNDKDNLSLERVTWVRVMHIFFQTEGVMCAFCYLQETFFTEQNNFFSSRYGQILYILNPESYFFFSIIFPPRLSLS